MELNQVGLLLLDVRECWTDFQIMFVFFEGDFIELWLFMDLFRFFKVILVLLKLSLECTIIEKFVFIVSCERED